MTWAVFRLWLGTPPGRWFLRVAGGLAVLLAIVGAVLFLRAHWIDQGVAKEKAAAAVRLEKGKKVVAEVEKAGAGISADVGQKLTKTQTEIRWRTRVQLQEVTRYVPVESDRACIVGVGALRLHDHAFAGLAGLPAVTGGPVEADSGVPLSALVADDVEFAGTAYLWRAEALAWREWYPRQAALWKAKIKAPEPAP
jgi:hypothetical protein